MEIFRDFHGKEPSYITETQLPDLTFLPEVARPEIITYFSNKMNGGGDGKMRGFKHDFHRTTRAYTDSTGRVLIIMGPKFRVTKRGLVG